MGIILTRKVSKKRSGALLLIVALAFVLLALTATGLSGSGRSAADRPAAPSVDAFQGVTGGETGPSEGVAAPPASNAPFRSTSGCDGSGTSGDLVGEASPRQVFENHLAQCRSMR
jgi:hypothetical protein